MGALFLGEEVGVGLRELVERHDYARAGAALGAALRFLCTRPNSTPNTVNCTAAVLSSTVIHELIDGIAYLPASPSTMYEARNAPIAQENLRGH